MTDKLFSNLPLTHAPEDEAVVTSDRDISHLLFYLSSSKEGLPEIEADFDRLLEQLGISAEEIKDIAGNNNITKA